MTIREAIKNGNAVEVEQDVYLLDDGRTLEYDRFFNRGRTPKWVDREGGYAYRNFYDAYIKDSLFVVELFPHIYD